MADTPTGTNKATSPRKRKAFRIALILATIAITFLAVEVGARVYIGVSGRNIERFKPITGHAQPNRVEPHPFLPFALTKNSRFNMEIQYEYRDELVSWTYSTNADGFRGGDVPREKDKNEFRVLTLGGSATFGEGVNDEETWPALLEALLQEKHPDLTVEVLNFGVPSGTSASALVLLALKGVHFQPDLVIYYEGVNDLVCCIGYENFETDYSHRIQDFNGLSPLFLRLPTPFYNSYAITLLNFFWNDALGNMDVIRPISQERSQDPLNGIEAPLANILSMKGIAEAHGAIFVLGTYHWYRPGEIEQAYNERLKELAVDYDLRMVDQDALIPHEDPSLHLDPVHFTLLGNQLMAENFATFLEANGLIP